MKKKISELVILLRDRLHNAEYNRLHNGDYNMTNIFRV